VRIMVTGATGQVGWELARALAPLGRVLAVDRRQCDLSQPERLPGIMRDLNPDVVVNAAAYTAVDDAERQEQLALTVNGAAAGMLAHEAAKTGALFIHYSTDYVFDGAKNAPYAENDPPCPVNAYGRSKLAGETAIQQAGGAYLILRTSWVFGARGRNFLLTMLSLMRQRDELRIVADQIGAPTSATDIARATAGIVSAAVHERENGRFASGLFHVTASGVTSWHGFAAAILDRARRHRLLDAGRNPRLTPIASEDYPRPAVRPRNSRLSCERLHARFDIALPAWEDGLAACMDGMAEKDAPSSSPPAPAMES
jgi:dTDP-4-dehydrorhamnose reductase